MFSMLAQINVVAHNRKIKATTAVAQQGLSMPTYKISWTADKSTLEAASLALSEFLDPPADAVSLTKDDAALGDDDAGWRLEAYFREAPDVDAIYALLGEHSKLTPGELEELPDQDWVAHSLEGLGVVRCGRFVLYGVHDADKLPNETEDIPIRIDANQAFGTGHHPTTAGCLTLLGRFAGWAPKSIFDLGCGSAILSIAAAKLWSRNILASDIDETSVEIARENAKLNGVDDKIACVTAAGFDHPDIEGAAPFDFVFANILAGPLKELAPDMAAHVAKNGRVMLAGLMAEQEPSVTAEYGKAGFRQINRLEDDTWPVLLLVKQ